MEIRLSKTLSLSETSAETVADSFFCREENEHTACCLRENRQKQRRRLNTYMSVFFFISKKLKEGLCSYLGHALKIETHVHCTSLEWKGGVGTKSGDEGGRGGGDLLTPRKSKQQTRVRMTKTVSHRWLLTTVSRPRYTKIIVSQTDANIFMKYLIVVCDFCEMFTSTYFFIEMPQNVHLQ